MFCCALTQVTLITVVLPYIGLFLSLVRNHSYLIVNAQAKDNFLLCVLSIHIVTLFPLVLSVIAIEITFLTLFKWDEGKCICSSYFVNELHE